MPSGSASRDPDPWWGPDKALHFSLAALLAGGGYALGSFVTDDAVGRAALCADLALSAVLAKEAADEAGLGTPSWRDFTWGVLGTALGISVSIAIDLGVEKSKVKGRK
jgi:putative lipoprotein